MASFAELDSNNIVIRVITLDDKHTQDENGNEQESIGVAWLQTNISSNTWKQTSVNTHQNVHSNGGTPFRKNHAGIDFTYDSTRDAFIRPKPHSSWILNETTCDWEPPIAYPTDGGKYLWNDAAYQADTNNPKTAGWDYLYGRE